MALILHIGFPKTATTSLQLAFQEHQDDLQAAGVCYPLVDDDFKQRFLKNADMKGFRRNPQMQKDFDTSFEAMKQVIAKSGCSDVILSCEELTNFMMMEFDEDNLRRLRDRLREVDTDIRLSVYVRNPSDFYLSILQERLKRNGGVFAAGGFKTNFARTIGLYERVFETDAVVREFHPTRLKDRDIVADFLDAVGLSHIDISGWEPISSNESLSPEALVVLDLARRELEESESSVSYVFAESELLWRRLRKLSDQAGLARKPILFKSAHDAVMESNRQECEAMRDKYGIEFCAGKFTEGEPAIPPEHRISDVESLMDVNRDRVYHIWSVLSLDLIREVFRMRNRVKKLRRFAESDD